MILTKLYNLNKSVYNFDFGIFSISNGPFDNGRLSKSFSMSNFSYGSSSKSN